MNMKNNKMKKYPFIVVMHTTSSILGLLVVYQFGYLIDNIIMKNKFELIESWFYTTIILVVISQVLSFYYYEFSNIDKSQENWKILMTELLKQLLNFSTKKYSEHEQAHYLNTLLNSASIYADIYTSIHIDLIANVLFIISILLVVIFLDIKLFILFVIFIVIECVLSIVPSKNLAHLLDDVLRKRDGFTSEIRNIIDRKREINILKVDSYFLSRFNKEVNMWFRFVRKYKFIEILIMKIPKTLTQIFNIIYLLLTAWMISNNQFSIGLLIVGYQYLNYVASPVFDVCNIIVKYKLNKENIKRVDELLKIDKEESIYYVDEANIFMTIHDLEIYTEIEHEKLLYKCLSLDIEKKTLNIIRGENGTGKSILLNLLSNNIPKEFSNGEFKISSDMKKLSYLTYPHLFVNGSFEDNLFGININPKLLDILNISDELFRKNITINPLNLSFGEQQKISLLRVLSKCNRVLFLDEPMSNLDLRTQSNLKEYILSLKGMYTVFIIMHDNLFDSYADNIMVIRDSKLIIENDRILKGCIKT